jgi:hypothetical protein
MLHILRFLLFKIYYIMLTFSVPVIFTFEIQDVIIQGVIIQDVIIQDVLKLKKNFGAKWLRLLSKLHSSQ